MSEIVTFLKTSVYGLIILGATGSVIGALFVFLSKKIYKWLLIKYKIQHFKFLINRITEQYFQGYFVGRAENSMNHQVVLVGKFIIHVVVLSTIIVVLLILNIWLLGIIPIQYYWIAAILIGFNLFFPIYILKRKLNYFNMMFNTFYDKEEIKSMADKFIQNEIINKNKQDLLDNK